MAKKLDEKIVVALDMGTSKIAVLVARITDSGEMEIIGFGMHPSRGLKKGVVVNIESAVQAMERALEEAELMAGCQIHSAITGIAGSHVKSLNSHGIVAIRDREVNQSDVDRVIDAAKAVAIPADQKILHILPQEFIVDSQEGVREPIGMSGVRLEARVHIVTGAVSAAQNIVKCVKRCGLQVNDIILEQLASSHSVLTPDEQELGVCLVDIGGGTTDVAVFTGGSIRHTGVIPIAGDHVTNDVAVALRTPTQSAEEIKKKYGSCIAARIDKTEMIQVPSVAKRPTKTVPRRVLVDVIEARYAELLALVAAELRRSGFEDLLTAGIVLTGGASNIPGILELAESIFNMPVRLGVPQNIAGLLDVRDNPSYATSVGLLMHGVSTLNVPPSYQVVRARGIWSRMRSWFAGNF